MTEIRDHHDHLVCTADAETGELRNVYNKQTVVAKLPIGGELLVRRRGVLTSIKRIPPGKFYVRSIDVPENLKM